MLLGPELPKLGGLEVLCRLRADERTRSLLVVVLASSEREREAIADLAPQAAGCIRCPVDFARFSEAV